jgi:uncharacterized protein YukE
MAMGTTGTVNITPEMMKNALTIIEDYRTKAANLQGQLKSEVDSLIPGSFSGSAATGFKAFYEEKIAKDLDAEGLTKLLDALRDICQGTLDAIPNTDGLDDQLGDGNKK